MQSNYDTAIKAEAKRVTRCLQLYTSEQRAMNAANFRFKHQQRRSMGEYFYTHPRNPQHRISNSRRGCKGRAPVVGVGPLKFTEQ